MDYRPSRLFRITNKGNGIMKIPENTLWQYLEKEHLDPDNKLTEEQWGVFLDEHTDEFGERTAEMGKDMMDNFKIENDIGEDRVLESDGMGFEIREESEFTDNDGNPISEDEQARADGEADRVRKGEDD